MVMITNLKGENKHDVLHAIEELITMFRLLKIKVESIPDDSDLLPYIAFTLTMGKKAASTLHKKFMIDQMTRIESESLKKEKSEISFQPESYAFSDLDVKSNR
jgi:hypothetical protein